jgi:TadE-like protein
MQKLLSTTLRILDGTPSSEGKPQKGQSLVEMALITPILIIMFMGMVEIGWFANNYLTLLDVTRAGARRGAVANGTLSPIEWNNAGSYLPTDFIAAGGTPLKSYVVSQGFSLNSAQLTMPYVGGVEPVPNPRDQARDCAPNDARRGFYEEVVCVMLRSLEPLAIRETNNVDEIIVSGFSLARVEALSGTGRTPSDYFAGGVGPRGDTGPQMVVVGRYPTNANECDVINTGTATVPNLTLQSAEPRDPFDFNGNGVRDMRAADNQNVALGEGLFTELSGQDARAASVGEAEKQLGFVWFGNHVVSNINGQLTGCLGSEWTSAEVEALVNLPSYEMTNTQRRELLPNQGLILVEMFWQHEMLLRFPVFNPVIAAFAGNQTPTISVWAAFPMPTVEPFIVFD